MPQIDRSISHVIRYIITPTSEQLVEKVLRYTGVYINRFKDNVYIKNLAQESDMYRKKDGSLNTDGYNKLVVEVNPVFNLKETKHDMAISKYVHNFNSHRKFMDYPIFRDKANDVNVIEYNNPTSVEMAFTMRFASIDEADEVAFSLNNKISVSDTAAYTDLTYWYLMPSIFTISMHRLFSMMKYKDHEDGTPFTFQDYLSIGSNKQIDLVRNRNNPEKHKTLGIYKTLSHVVGRFSYDFSKPNVELVGRRGNAYFVSFNYTYQFMCPSFVRLDYPLLIRNKYIPVDMAEIKPTSMMNDNVPSSHNDNAMQDYFINNEKIIQDRFVLPPVIVYPKLDDWKVKNNFIDYAIASNLHHIFQGIIQPEADEEGNLRLSINISQTYFKFLDENGLTELKKALIEIFHVPTIREDMIMNKSPLLIGVFENDNLIAREEIYIKIDPDSDDIIVYLPYYDINERYTYRLLLGIQTSIDSVLKKYLVIMVNYSDVFTRLVYDNLNKLDTWGIVEIVDDSSYESTSNRIDKIHAFRQADFVFKPKR